jgi:hypothetical protein
MDTKTKYKCITTKILTIFGILMGIALTPFNIYLYDITYDFYNYTTLQSISIVTLLLWSFLEFL